MAWQKKKTLKDVSVLPLEEQIKSGEMYTLNLLNRRDYSVTELKNKLREKGYLEDASKEIIAYLAKFHYTDDVRMAGTLIRQRKSYKSKAEIKNYLRQKFISDEDIQTAMEENYFAEGENPEETAIKIALEKLHIDDEALSDMEYEAKQKLASKFYRKGFSPDLIRKNLNM